MGATTNNELEWRVFRFSIMVAYGVHIATKVSDYRYDVRGQGHIYFRPVYSS